MSWFDDFIGVFSPRAKYRRIQYKRANDAMKKRKYDGAARTRRTANWRAPSSSQNAESANSIETLRNRSRDMVRNNPWANRAVSLISANVVGKGILPAIQSPTPELSRRHQELWQRWASNSQLDYDCRLNFPAIQALVMKSVVESGEVIIRRRRVERSRNILGTQLQILEADHIVTNRIFRNASNGNRVVLGIEIDDADCPVAYHLYENHPGNIGVEAVDIKNPLKIIRVPIEDIIHVFRIDRPGMLRGVPWLSNAIIRLRELDEMEDAQLVKTKVSAVFSAFIHDIEPPPKDPTLQDDEFELEKLEPGIVEYLPPGKDIKFANPNLPAADTYTQYTSSILHSIAAGIGVSFEALTGILSEVNFSSARMGWLEFHRNIETWRAHMIDPMLNAKVFKWFLEGAQAIGENTTNVRASWSAPRREMIDPTKEVPALQTAVRSGFITLSEAIRQLGCHPTDHFAEIKADNDILDQLELKLDTDPRNTTVAGKVQETETSE